MSKVVVVCGSRSWTDRQTIRRALRQLPKGTIIRHGKARGADTIAAEIARELGFSVEAFEPNYAKYGRYIAPKKRNTEMLDTEPIPKSVIAFWDGASGGTKDTLDKAAERSIHAIIYAPKKVKE